jgi:hypothetical protein
MKTTLTLICFLALLAMATASYGQATGIPAPDAVTFLNDLSNNDDQEGAAEDIAKILSYYSGRDITMSNLESEIGNMPFLKDYKSRITSFLPKTKSTNLLTGSPTGGGSGLAGLNVTNIADGIAKFLIKRGKQELSMAFFNRFSDTLKKYPEIRYIFPKTSGIVQNVDLNSYEKFLQELKDAFSKDLLKLPANILSLRNIPDAECNGDVKCLARLNAIRAHFATGASPDPRAIILPLIVIQNILDGNTIIEAADQLAADPVVCGNNDDINGAIKLTAILLASMKNGDSNGGVFVDAVKMKAIFYSKDNLKVLFGLVYQQYNRNDCYKSLTVNNNSLEQLLQKILDTQQQFYSGVAYINQVNFSYKLIQGQIQKGLRIDAADVASLSASSLNLFTSITNSFYSTLKLPQPAEYSPLIKNLGTGVDICTDIQQKNYSGIFTDAVKLLNDNQLIGDPAKANTTKYLAFAANLASASNSDEVENAIETVALPPGSYSVKQKSRFNVSLNGYIGYAWDFNKFGKDLYASGIYAPVGFTASTSLSRKNGGALSIFASVIDVGSLASYRIRNSATDTLKQQVRLESIISPSAQLIFAIPKWPVAVSAGWRMTPKMFYSNNQNLVPVKARSVFNLAILIDIPIFTIYNRPLD